ncbi:MAG: DoxX family protein [Saprospiraceae bacterium]|nr:DoxX family protein [Saprospiraceae bacterium]
MTPIDKNKDIALLVLRVVLGAFMIYGHGWPKLMRLFGGEEIQFMNFLGLGSTVSLVLAVFAEVVCALLVMAGAFTRLATIPLIFTMGIAAFVSNAGGPFSAMEKALLFMVGFIAIAIAGAGWYSVDARFRNKI